MSWFRPRVTILTEEQKSDIHRAALQILEKTGMIVKEGEMLEILRAGGARIGGDQRVRLPAGIVDENLAKSPDRVVIYDRKGLESLVLEGRNSYFGVHGDAMFFLDPGSRSHREFVAEDAAKVARLCDALTNIDFISQNGFGGDIPNPRAAAPVVFKRMVENTTKPLGFSCYDVDTFQMVLEIADVVRGGREALRKKPFFYHYSEPTSPLVHSAPSLRRLMMAVRNNIPLVYTPMPMSAATAPATPAGSIALCLAETLSGVVFAQMIRPGAPCIMGGITTIMDMRTTICSYGAPEMHLMVAALTEMAHRYRLPMFGTAGCTDAATADQQAAVESSLSCMMAALSGANLIHDVGLVYHAESVSTEMMVLSDEIIGMVKRCLEGVRTSPEEMALEVIERVQPGGNFLTDQHTLQHFRSFWSPTLFDRSTGSRDGFNFSENLARRVREIVDSHEPPLLAPEIQTELDKIEKCLMHMTS